MLLNFNMFMCFFDAANLKTKTNTIQTLYFFFQNSKYLIHLVYGLSKNVTYKLLFNIIICKMLKTVLLMR